ncbi:hypothetical protein [Corynebacterium mayonis]|uniref:hypothetical protein n=1 Tax=Corynebacterium mayonis TaxID=3062461 RepID=UPI003140C06E
MRNFRTSAVAAATALTLAITGVGVASAQTDGSTQNNGSAQNDGSSQDNGSAQNNGPAQNDGSSQDNGSAQNNGPAQNDGSSQDNGSAQNDGSSKDNGTSQTNNSGSSAFTGKQVGDKDFGDVLKDGFGGLSSGKGSSHFFPDAKEPFYGADAFGKEINMDNVPQWARYLIDLTVLAGIGTLIGAVISAFNWASYNGLIKF